MTVPVVFSTDHNYVMPTAVAIASMLEASDDCDCEIFILQSADVTDTDREGLRTIAQSHDAAISFITMGSEFDGLFEIREITKAAYYRLFIPWFIPQHDKIVYVDGDLIFRRSVRELYETAKDSSKYVAGVHTAGYDTERFRRYTKSIGISPEGYINSGVLVINAALQRKMALCDRFRIHFSNNYIFQDQDIINLVCRDHIELIGQRFNCIAYIPEERVSQPANDPVIVHYAGLKPWRTFTPHWLEWWLNCAKTRYYDEDLARSIENKELYRSYKSSDLLRLLLKNVSPGLYEKLRRHK